MKNEKLTKPQISELDRINSELAFVRNALISGNAWIPGEHGPIPVKLNEAGLEGFRKKQEELEKKWEGVRHGSGDA